LAYMCPGHAKSIMSAIGCVLHPASNSTNIVHAYRIARCRGDSTGRGRLLAQGLHQGVEQALQDQTRLDVSVELHLRIEAALDH